MRLVGYAGFAAAILAVSQADAQQTIKIGLILPYSGQFADPGAQADNGIKLYMQQHGDTVAGRKIEIVRRDTGGIAPDVAKRLAQELVVRDKVDLLAGFSLTPNALAAADVSAQAKKFMVVMNAAASIVTTKSPYMARVSFTLPQLNEPTRTGCGRFTPSWRISRPAMTPKRPSRARSKRPAGK
jgi:branched-chain amino acid transport system substrate-binding protein